MDLKDYLDQSGLTAHRFSIMTGLSHQTILNLLSGKRAHPLTIKVIKKITRKKVDLSDRMRRSKHHKMAENEPIPIQDMV